MNLRTRTRSMFLGLICALSTVLFAAEKELPSAESASVLAIHIENGTAGGQVSEGTPLTVYFYRNSELIQQTSGLTDDEGNCTMENIPSGDDITAIAQARHSDMAFSSAPLLLPREQNRHALSFRVFDIAYDSSLIRVGTHHIIIKQEGDYIAVDEYVQLVNDSDRAVLSDRKDEQGRYKVVECALPDGFSELAFSSYFHADAIVQTAHGFYDTMAVPPGSYDAIFSYRLPLNPAAIEFRKTVAVQTGRMMLFVQNPGLTVTGLGGPVGSMNLSDGTAVDYYAVDADQGSVLQFRLSGRPAPDQPQENNWIVLSILFAVVILLAVFRFARIKPR